MALFRHALVRELLIVAHRDELLYGRPDQLKVFVSSEMRSQKLTAERAAAAEAIEESGFHFAWYWERDADAGPYSSEPVCLGQARTSDCLVLILGGPLTPITQMEYEEAWKSGASCFIFVHSGLKLDEAASDFLKEQMTHVVYKKFGSVPELKTAIVQSLLRHAVQSVRRYQLDRSAIISGSRSALTTAAVL